MASSLLLLALGRGGCGHSAPAGQEEAGSSGLPGWRIDIDLELDLDELPLRKARGESADWKDNRAYFSRADAARLIRELGQVSFASFTRWEFDPSARIRPQV